MKTASSYHKPMLAALLAALLALPSAAQAANLHLSGGHGGGGGTNAGETLGGMGGWVGMGGGRGGDGGRGYRWDGGRNLGGGGGGGGAYVGEGSGFGGAGTDANSSAPGTHGAGVCDLPVGTCNGASAGADGSLAGGAGGSARWQVMGSREQVFVTGGSGGSGGNGGGGAGTSFAGGAGGEATLVLWNDFSATRYLELRGGDGGNGGDGSGGNGGMGAAGGAARLDGGAFALTANRLDVVSGKAGKPGTGNPGEGEGGARGAGGAATLEAGTLKAGNIFLTKQDGDLSVKVGTLDVTDRNTTLTLNNTAADEVSFTQAALGGGYTLTATGNGVASVGTLRLTGTGRLSIDGSVPNITTLDITTLELGDHTLAATGDGKARIGTLRLTGAGRIYAAGDSDPNSYGRFQVGRLASDGGVLTDTGVFNWYNLATNHRVYTNRDIEIQGGGLTIDLSAGNQDLNRKLTGVGHLTKQGTSTLTLGSANTYTGVTEVREGALRLTNLGATGTGAVYMTNRATLELAAEGRYANQITGAGKVTANPGMGNTLTLTNTGNGYSGGTNVASGMLEMTKSGQLGTGGVHVENGATLRLNARLGSRFPALTSTGGTLEVWAGAGGNLTDKLDGFSRYAFNASALSTNLAALTVLNNPTLAIDANQVSLDTTNGGLSLQFGQSAALISLSSGTLTLTGGGVAQRIRLDNAPSGLVESAYSLTTGTSTNTLYLAFAEHYLYGTGGKNTTGQRERDNTLNLTSGMAAAAAAFGGRAATGDATGNTVNMAGGALVQDASNPLSGNVYGGHADTGSAVNNTVAMSGGNAVHVNGGWSQASATSNTVDMSDGQANYVYGGYSDGGSAESNTVTISGNAEVTDDVCGGWGRVSATGNTLDMPGGQAHSVHGGCSDTGSVERNTVTISGNAEITGGYVSGGNSAGGDASGNTVTLDGGIFSAAHTTEVYGGFSGAAAGAATTTDNTITLGAGFTGDYSNVALHGGNLAATGNTLKVETDGVTVKSINNFDEYVFSASALGAATSALTLAAQPAALDIDAAKVRLDDSTPFPAFQPGDTITLVASNDAITVTPSTISAGGYTFALSAGTNSLIATVIGSGGGTGGGTGGGGTGGGTGGGGTGGGTGGGGAAPGDCNCPSAPAMREIGLLFSGIALAGVAAPALRRREKQRKKTDTSRLFMWLPAS